MKFLWFSVFLLGFLGYVGAQDTCEWCFRELSCEGPSAGNPNETCWSCIRSECETEFTLRNLASRGVDCIKTSWMNESLCSSSCPEFTPQHELRLLNLKTCLGPCVDYAVENGVAQCSPDIPQDFTDPAQQCVAKEVTGECGSCYRQDMCFTADELEPSCRAHLDAECPGSFDSTCMIQAWQDASSTCPAINATITTRLTECGTCLSQCAGMSACLKTCKDQRPPFPDDVPCALCRALCAGTANPTECVTQNCDCVRCDECVASCKSQHGTNFFALLDPCVCLERATPLSTSISPRILGGTETCQGDYPFMAYLYEQPQIYSGFICGGSLITDEWVVTAAHCIGTVNPLLYGVVLGEVNRLNDSCAEQHFTLSSVTIHPDYNSITFDNDVALLKLSRRATINRFVMPVNLVANGTRTDEDTNSMADSMATCYVAGWGDTSSPNGQLSDILLELAVNIFPFSICNFRTTGEAAYTDRVVNEGDPKFCAGGVAGEDTCSGDSGGPLVCLHPDQGNQLFLYGLTSYGPAVCGLADLPGIYTKIADVRPWIDQTILGVP